MNWLAIVVFAVLLAVLGAAAFQRTPEGWRLGLVFLSLATLLRVSGFANSLYCPQAASLAFLPMADAEIAGRVWFDRLRRNSAWFLMVGTWYLTTTMLMKRGEVHWSDFGTAILASVWHEAVAISLATIWLGYFSHARLGVGLGLVIVASLPTLLFGATVLAEPLRPAVPWLLFIIPTGWVAGAWLAWHATTPINPGVYWSLAVVAVGWLPWAYARMCEMFEIREIEFFGTQGMTALASDVSATAAPGAAAAEETLAEIGWGRGERKAGPKSADDVRRALQHVGQAYRGGFLARLALSRFSARDRVILQLLMAIEEGDELGWERRYLGALRWLAILMAIVCALPERMIGPGLAFMPIVLVTLVGTPALGGVWMGIQNPLQSLGVKTLPIGYRETARIMLRINRVRVLAWLPVALAGCALAGWKGGIGAEAGLEIGLVLIALQPAAVMVQIHQGTKDRCRAYGAPLVAALAIAIIGLGLTSGVLLFMLARWMVAAGAVGIFVAAELMFQVGRWRYERCLVDIDSQSAVQQYWR
jgi:hypothetical protein